MKAVPDCGTAPVGGKFRRERETMMRTALLAGAALALALTAGAAAAQEWLALCSRCLSPTIHTKTGIGTANAVAIARITREAAEGWCENWQPGQVAACVREQMASPEAQRDFRASADCTAGRITPVDGNTYRLDGAWPRKSMGEGRSRWRDAQGRVVGIDTASGGLGISQQWEVLCPNATRAAVRPAPPPRAAPAPQQATPQAAYQVGQQVEARYGSDWIRGRVTKLIPTTTRGRREMHYEVVLENRQRGILPPDWVRPLPAP
jgi:hypothetical protein